MINRERGLERRLEKIQHASDDLGKWLSAALEDPNVCDEMKQDIQVWFDTIEASEHTIKQVLTQPQKHRIDHIIYGPGVHDCRVILDDGSILDGVESINPHKITGQAVCKVDLTLNMIPSKLPWENT